MKKIFLSAQERFFSREFPKKRLTEPGRPTIPLSRDAAVAQLDRATGYEPVCREFESLRAHQQENFPHFHASCARSSAGYEPVGREFESLQPHQNFEGLMMNNHESFFRTRKSVPNLSAANRNRLMALLNAPSTVFASPQPACRIPPKKASSYRGYGASKTGSPSRESRSPTPSAMAVSCMGRSRSI